MKSRLQIYEAGAARQSVFCAFYLRRGFTLIELLVVIAIISAVTIATVPMILPALDVRRIREASRIVSTHFASAQSDAIATGRPVGVWIERLTGENTAAMDLFTCEVPPPYAGDSITSQLTVKVDATTGVGTVVFAASDMPALSDTFLRPGDLIRFAFRGPYFRLTGQNETLITNTNNQVMTTQNVDYLAKANNTRTSPVAGYVFLPVAMSDYQTTPSPTKPIYRGLPAAAYGATGWPTAYQILRSPVKSAGSSVQLPAGAAIDLAFSGIGTDNFYNVSASDNKPIVFTFNKSGGLDSITFAGTTSSVTAPLYFLIGKRGKLPPPSGSFDGTADDKYNFLDSENIWIAINPQTGLITTAEAAQGSTSNMINQRVVESRAFATSAQTMGGR